VRGPLTAPVIAGGLVYVARPDAHEVVALEIDTGQVRWRFVTDGRTDTPPTIHRGLCLIGTRSGWVYCLRADDGQVVWRLRAAPSDEQIVSYGQLESPWPVPGSVLVVDEVAFFAAGRQPLADGGILVFAVEPATGRIRWVNRVNTLPMDNFYACIGLEFDSFDLLHREGDAVAMSRWLFRRSDGRMSCKAKDAFAVFRSGGFNVAVARGCWTYGPRHQPRHGGERSPMRPLAAFRGSHLFGCLADHRTVYRRDFRFDRGERFDTTWITGWDAGKNFNKKQGPVWRSDRLSENAVWSVPVFGRQPEQEVAGMVLAGDKLVLAGSQGGLWVLAAQDGRQLARLDTPPVLWDTLAAAERANTRCRLSHRARLVNTAIGILAAMAVLARWAMWHNCARRFRRCNG